VFPCFRADESPHTWPMPDRGEGSPPAKWSTADVARGDWPAICYDAHTHLRRRIWWRDCLLEPRFVPPYGVAREATFMTFLRIHPSGRGSHGDAARKGKRIPRAKAIASRAGRKERRACSARGRACSFQGVLMIFAATDYSSLENRRGLGYERANGDYYVKGPLRSRPLIGLGLTSGP
jgi:hypothetical protein